MTWINATDSEVCTFLQGLARDTQGLSAVSTTIPGQATQANVLRQGMCQAGETCTHTGEETSETHHMDIQTTHRQGWLCAYLCGESPLCQRQIADDGTPHCDGASPWTAPATLRNGPSQKWDTDRQSPGEPGASDETRPYASPCAGITTDKTEGYAWPLCEHYISLAALAAGSYPTCSSATALSALSRSTRTASRCSCNGNGTACSPGSLCGEMYAPLTATHGADRSMSLQAASPVRTSPLPGQERVFTARAQAYGQSSPVSLAKYDRATHSLKIPQLSLFEASMSSLQTLPRWGWMRAGAVWGLMMSAPRTSGNASGYWPSPTVTSLHNRKGASPTSGDGLATAVARQMWPTPNVPNGGRTTWHAEQEGQSLYHNGKKVQLVLEQVVRIWATPSARDWRSGLASEATMEKNARPLSEQVGGTLSPEWVALLMGWPQRWTYLEPLSNIEYNKWLRGFIYATNEGRREILPYMRCTTGTQTIWPATGGPKQFQEEEVLQPQLREYAQSRRQASTALESTSPPSGSMRWVWYDKPLTRAPLRRQPAQHHAGQSTDPLYPLPQISPRYGPAAWMDGSWENGVSRTASNIAHRVVQLRALGNGQVPHCAALAWRILMAGMEDA